ncbi:MAG: hybrid sensor histidine kinase/response regulator [Pseudopedobacter sp.]|nr:hybrid sensor histidine kinase/response regulator [Deinococcales bacterium]
MSPESTTPREHGERLGLKRVLTVDDSSLIRSALRGIFQEADIALEEAKGGLEALEKLEELDKYDLILLDVMMPDLSGLEVLEQIRARSNERVVVMLTGSDDLGTAIRAIRQGADGYLQKNDLLMRSDHTDFFYALEQAMNYRSGLIAQQQLEQLKKDLYNMVTHDLRNPANIISMTLELVLEEAIGPLTALQREQLGLADEAAQKLVRLVGDYLDYAKIDEGYFTLEPSQTNLGELIESCVRQTTVLAQARGQTLTVYLSQPVLLMADSARLKQTVDNILSNAVKYTPEGGTIDVQLSVQGQYARVCVQDSGQGISSEDLKTLFGKFQRLPGEGRRTQGTGLGLLICKTIVEAHGGKIWAESRGIPGEGSTFIFELPLQSS